MCIGSFVPFSPPKNSKWRAPAATCSMSARNPSASRPPGGLGEDLGAAHAASAPQTGSHRPIGSSRTLPAANCPHAATPLSSRGMPCHPGMAMTVFKIVRFAVRPDACSEVEQAMREFALYVGLELEDSSWTTYRDRRNPNVYVALITADDEDAAQHQRTAGGSVQFARALQTRLLTDVETREYELVATSRGGLPP